MYSRLNITCMRNLELDQTFQESEFDLLSLLFCVTMIEDVWLRMKFATVGKLCSRGEKDHFSHIRKDYKNLLNQC